MAYVLGRDLIRALQETLGLGDRAVRRIVLDFQIDSAVKAYVEEYVQGDKLTALFGELRRVRPEVMFVDRISVENANGTEIVVKQVELPDDEEARACRLFLQRYAKSSEEERIAIRRALAE